MAPPAGSNISNDMASESTSLNRTSSATIARSLYNGADVEGSRQYHQIKSTASSSSTEEAHQSEGGFMKPIIFGGLDGILTSFAIVAGSAGGNLSPKVVLILGFSNIFADALSMGVGEFLSSKAENEWILSERRREEWELENYPQGEIKEMIEIYEAKGMNHDDAVLVIETMAKYKDFFVDIMMSQELELQVPEDNHIQESMKEGLVMFCAFAFFGALPLLGYVIIPIIFPELGKEYLFTSACIITGCVLFFMGAIKSWFTTHHWIHTGTETLLLGGVCATVAFTIGQVVESWVGSDGK